MFSIRRCLADERQAMLSVIDAAAEAYRDVIPADRWQDPYMPSHELDAEIAGGVHFWGYETAGATRFLARGGRCWTSAQSYEAPAPKITSNICSTVDARPDRIAGPA